MKKYNLLNTFILISIILALDTVIALPMDTAKNVTLAENTVPEIVETQAQAVNSTEILMSNSSDNSSEATPITDLEMAGSEQKEQTFEEAVGPQETSDNTAVGNTFDPTIYGGFLTPEAFQQYVSQFGAAYPYGAAPYPAPMLPGYMPSPPPPMYPSPYVVQTGYEGYLVPSTTTSTAANTATKNSSSTTSTVLMQPLMLFNNIVSTFMMSTLFKIAATLISAIGMIFFSGAIMNLICTYTPICDMSNRAVTYLRRRDTAERMGLMIAEGMTPERIRRASEFVQGAIRKYQQLQVLIGEKHGKD